MPTAKYSNYLEINPSFESVVDIDADTRNTNLWREYIVGDDMESLVEQMCQSIGNEAPDLRRSFWISRLLRNWQELCRHLRQALDGRKAGSGGRFSRGIQPLGEVQEPRDEIPQQGRLPRRMADRMQRYTLRRHDAAGDGTSNTAGAGCKIR